MTKPNTGSNIATSLLAIPPLLQSPPRLLATQWKELFDRGKAFVVPLTVGSTAAFALLAYLASQKELPHQTAVQAYVAAALGVFSLVPYTLLVMGSTNDSLYAAGEEVLKQDAAGNTSGKIAIDVKAMVQQWSSLNFVRGLLLLGGATAGIYGTLVDYRL